MEEKPAIVNEKELDSYTTECEHNWEVIVPDPSSDLVSLGCTKCWAGISVAKENVAKHLKA